MRIHHEINPVEDAKNDFALGVYKYVNVNGKYHFTSGGYGGSHANLVDPGETAISAGTISYQPELGYWSMVSPYSMTLKVGAIEADYAELTKILGVPFMGD